MNMKAKVLGVSIILAWIDPAAAQTSGFGPGFDNWNFTATKERNGVTNCRATRKVGGRDDIIALKTDRTDYVSVRAEGRTGKWRDSFIVPFREPKNGQQMPGTIEANGQRMWMPVDRNFIETLMKRGGYEMYLGGSEDRDSAPLGGQAAKAFIRLKECIVANGG
ncbi:hypothetical protein [Methylobacterium nonmethylotrophicum]|uniref:Invasion associated locus B family protein n=1 Tax=Methylobacterium nonmethylotrophicum TaxID=1141884 RepID=A0A4Z0NFN3_9HYPH|nr:hypothetical protein [Methylobacterium nonmethylotrophicum]TGD95120.1 hypothetical protein EU555_29530 [Methylobacterium nonmethylotrophicum]